MINNTAAPPTPYRRHPAHILWMFIKKQWSEELRLPDWSLGSSWELACYIFCGKPWTYAYAFISLVCRSRAQARMRARPCGGQLPATAAAAAGYVRTIHTYMAALSYNERPSLCSWPLVSTKQIAGVVECLDSCPGNNEPYSLFYIHIQIFYISIHGSTVYSCIQSSHISLGILYWIHKYYMAFCGHCHNWP